MMKILKMLLFSFLIGIVLTVTSIWWWHDWWNYNDYLQTVAPPETVFYLPSGGCIKDGGPLPFFGTCIENKILNFGVDIVFWSTIVFSFWMLIKFLRKRKG